MDTARFTTTLDAEDADVLKRAIVIMSNVLNGYNDAAAADSAGSASAAHAEATAPMSAAAASRVSRWPSRCGG